MTNKEDLLQSKKALLVTALESVDPFEFNKLADIFTETLEKKNSIFLWRIKSSLASSMNLI